MIYQNSKKQKQQRYQWGSFLLNKVERPQAKDECHYLVLVRNASKNFWMDRMDSKNDCSKAYYPFVFYK